MTFARIGLVLLLCCQRPFFLKTKEEPIRTPDPTARARPTYLKAGGLASLPDAMALSDVSAAEADAMALESECTADDAEALAASAASTEEVGAIVAVLVIVATVEDMV